MGADKIIPCCRWIIIFLLLSCAEKYPPVEVNSMFTLLPSVYTGIDFENTLVDELGFNVFKYRNYYNGGGVAIGDINSDYLPDIYLVANNESNRLYINKGNMQFKDVTKDAGVAGLHKWSTGVCMVDINGDGLLDIYVCNSGNIKGDSRANELFINQGSKSGETPTFKEAAADYGIDDNGFSTHAAFFDYDNDGDLDLYVLNNAFRAISTFDLSNNLRRKRDLYGGDKLYRNDGGVFKDVSEITGIYGSVIGFGLGLMVADVNNDNWMDIYVANDFFERDYLYINNQDGTYKEQLEEMISHVSLSSMGGDIADINNDGFLDIFTTDMLPEDDYRLKTTFTYEPFEYKQKEVDWGYYHQLSQNSLQLNNGFGLSSNITFSDIGFYAGLAQTDWSWCTMIVDLNNDGLKDIFITNGMYRDVTDQDYLDFLRQDENIQKVLKGDFIDIPELIRKIPSTKLSNYAFQNSGDLTFNNQAKMWGLDKPSFSNGAAYGDLDGDGDNDLIINNVNQAAFVYRNETNNFTDNHYLKVRLFGEGMNTYAIGARVSIQCKDQQQIFVQELMPMKVFQSSVDYVLTIGLGENNIVDTLVVDWPNGTRIKLDNIQANQSINLYQKHSQPYYRKLPKEAKPLLKEITATFPVQYQHVENRFIDFHREPLMPHILSNEGPKMTAGDINGDGLDDLFIGGAKGSPGQLLIQTDSGSFISTNEQLLIEGGISEDIGSAFFDADGDGDLDLYVVSGGNEYSTRAPALLDRLYLNNGMGSFNRSTVSLPHIYASGSCVAPADFDNDGDIDLFLGSRSVPWKYGLTPTSYLLENDGVGNFHIVTDDYNPKLATVGMVTDADWIDYDNDEDLDLIIVGEWMPVTVIQNNGTYLLDVTVKAGLGGTNGWWNCVLSDDINGDGYLDLVVGNLGKNSKIWASESEPATIYIGDFDHNGLTEQIICYYKNGKSYPMGLRPDLVKQIPMLKDQFPTHADYAGTEITDVFTVEQLKNAIMKNSYTFANSIFYGNKTGIFRYQPLPTEAQFSPVYAIMSVDFNSDGWKDLLLGGNFYGVNPQRGRYDASHGIILNGDGSKGFIPMSIQESGLNVTGQVRDIISITYQQDHEAILFAKNNDKIQVYTVVNN